MTAKPMPDVEEVTTDAGGRFAVTLRERARVLVRAEHPAHAPAELGPFDHDPSVGLAALELVLGAGGTLEGRVTAPGARSAGVVVAISRGDGRARSTRTDADGHYRFEHLMPGRWFVTTREVPLEPGTSSHWDSRPAHVQVPTNCVVREGEVTRFDVERPPDDACVVRGRIVLGGAPAAGWRAELVPDEVEGVERASGAPAAVEDDGSFEVALARPGPATLRLEPTAVRAPYLLLELDGPSRAPPERRSPSHRGDRRQSDARRPLSESW